MLGGRRHCVGGCRIPIFDVIPPERRFHRGVRRFNRSRGWLIGLAIWFSLLPFSVVHTDNIRWWMLRDDPKQAVYVGITVLGCWAAHYLVGRRVRAA